MRCPSFVPFFLIVQPWSFYYRCHRTFSTIDMDHSLIGDLTFLAVICCHPLKIAICGALMVKIPVVSRICRIINR